MIWLCIFIYFLGAIITGLCVYTFYVKEYNRIKTKLEFKYWIESRYETILILSLSWVILLPIGIIAYFINKIIKRINKHYNID